MISRKEDWHSADIIAALRKRGTTLAALSRQSGLSSSTLANALVRPWPKGERIIAEALEKHPSEIWPSRYLKIQNNRLHSGEQQHT
ncbi:transcriptional regulator [Limnobaculum zhutongyuii]|uniref:Transcriptional regulator n=1 Tax=Limnobaculum zhutongyuii TaxID=2498113 RepID=A0A411WG90_9GAMM|nr:helix-turn-helix transcriptional regulator [Limnobaculum zhutongyuii]QBH95255.1 transcriptional regulator [Limnobaculum zhutongyuii]TQS89127.1 transcriptional regulator [Limnobaculum zhutongyuii]